MEDPITSSTDELRAWRRTLRAGAAAGCGLACVLLCSWVAQPGGVRPDELVSWTELEQPLPTMQLNSIAAVRRNRVAAADQTSSGRRKDEKMLRTEIAELSKLTKVTEQSAGSTSRIQAIIRKPPSSTSVREAERGGKNIVLDLNGGARKDQRQLVLDIQLTAPKSWTGDSSSVQLQRSPSESPDNRQIEQQVAKQGREIAELVRATRSLQRSEQPALAGSEKPALARKQSLVMWNDLHENRRDHAIAKENAAVKRFEATLRQDDEDERWAKTLRELDDDAPPPRAHHPSLTIPRAVNNPVATERAVAAQRAAAPTPMEAAVPENDAPKPTSVRRKAHLAGQAAVAPSLATAPAHASVHEDAMAKVEAEAEREARVAAAKKSEKKSEAMQALVSRASRGPVQRDEARAQAASEMAALDGLAGLERGGGRAVPAPLQRAVARHVSRGVEAAAAAVGAGAGEVAGEPRGDDPQSEIATMEAAAGEAVRMPITGHISDVIGETLARRLGRKDALNAARRADSGAAAALGGDGGDGSGRAAESAEQREVAALENAAGESYSSVAGADDAAALGDRGYTQGV